MGKVKSWLTGIGMAAAGIVGGEVHGRNNAHDAAITEQNRQFDINTSEGKKAAEKAANEKKEHEVARLEKEKQDQAILAEAYSGQLSNAELKLKLSNIDNPKDNPKEVQEMQKNNLNKLAEEIVGNSSKWLKQPSFYSGVVLEKLSKIYTKDEVGEMAKNNPDFKQLVSNQIALIEANIKTSDGNQSFAKKQGHLESPEETKDYKDYRDRLNEDISQIGNLL